MRLLRKLQAAAHPLKLSRLLIAMGACAFCFIGLKSMISLEDASSQHHNGDVNVSKADRADQQPLQDAPSHLEGSFQERRRRNQQQRPVKVPSSLPSEDDRNNDEYPGWVDEASTAQPEVLLDEVESIGLRGTIPEPRDGDRRNIVTKAPLKYRIFRTEIPGNVQGAPPSGPGAAFRGGGQFMVGQPQLFPGGDPLDPFRTADLQPMSVSNQPGGFVVRPGVQPINQPLPEMVNQPLAEMVNQPGNFAVGPGVVPRWAGFRPAAGSAPGVPSALQNVPAVMTTATVRVVVKERLVHFDLKGAPPLVSYYKEIFPLLKKIGATGLLMEYEDMFPYTGRLKVVKAKNAYSRDDIVTILRLAKENGLYVIPLVQTFGHLEFVLKHKEFRHLREVDNFPQAVCPTRNGTFQLVQELIAQNMALHPDAEYLHIGADEVYHIGMCEVCSKLASEAGQISVAAKHRLFLSYVSQVLMHTRSTYPAVKPIMWDDMFHTMTAADIKAGFGDLVNYVEPMIWSYFPDWPHHLPLNGDLYADVFPNIWGATAFKGSAGETLQMPNIKTQGMIHTSWIDALRFNGHKMRNFRGIALSGWSRYDHFYPLCELFPVSVPSLAINMQVLVDGEMNLPGMQLAAKHLNCQAEPSTLDFLNTDPNLEQFANCKFPGVEVYRVVHGLLNLISAIEPYFKELEGKFPSYQLRLGYMQGWRIEEPLTRVSNYENMMQQYIQQAKPAFAAVYDESTLIEWEAGYVAPVWNKVVEWKAWLINASRTGEWPARPLNIPTLAPLAATVPPMVTAPSTMVTAPSTMVTAPSVNPASAGSMPGILVPPFDAMPGVVPASQATFGASQASFGASQALFGSTLVRPQGQLPRAPSPADFPGQGQLFF
ncbi:Hexosaminidase D [Hypsibius exemplaris]|uniref:beta-N-acetylhexosaminidase n=1 Tax=Hypsibius exemplaris TaxID=2072580 RepID=A0A1W0WF18_HYPEX|nr:Hexosaminidase D [Hypsibius exemplaris]